jgi:hypothetical protein
MKGARFADVASIQERVTVVPKEAFADSFQKLYERCQQCVYNQFNTTNFNPCLVPDDGSKKPKHVAL